MNNKNLYKASGRSVNNKELFTYAPNKEEALKKFCKYLTGNGWVQTNVERIRKLRYRELKDSEVWVK
jgi:hypothetical protein